VSFPIDGPFAGLGQRACFPKGRELWLQIYDNLDKVSHRNEIDPSEYPALDQGFVKVYAKAGTPPATLFQGLELLRFVTFCAQETGRHASDPVKIAYYEWCYAWVRYLVGDEVTTATFYLQQYVVTDTRFYRGRDPSGEGSLRPKSRAEWPGAWKGVLRWLRHPERLTVGELELALAVFEWTAERPRFVWWLRERPHILWRIHRFLLKRYGYELLVPFCKALRADGLDQPPFRAGELWLLQPRIAGLSFIGFLAVVGLLRDVDLFCGPCMAGGGVPPGVLWAGSLLCALLLWVVVYVDVFKQNRGVMSSLSHGVRRVWQTVFYFLWWGTVFSIGYVWGAGALLGLNIGVDPGYRAVAAAFTAAAACLIGALLQWFWEDRAATEPV